MFREHALRLVGEMARRYGAHPAVRLWHVSNELGCHNGRCYCDVSAAAFRRWLTDRYGSVDKLNDAWGTAFWSQHYGGFDQVLPPRITPAVPNPTQALDFARFCSDELLSYYRAERDVLRSLSPEVPVTTNFMVTSHQNEQDYFRWAPAMDVISQDHYLDHRLPDPRAEQAFFADLTRGVAGGRPWMLMESATSAVNWQPVNVATRPGELLLDSLRQVARGADAVGFFQWRASRAGGEKYHSALVPHAGPDSAQFREVVALGVRAGRARRGGRQPGAGRRRAALGLGVLVGLRPALAPVGRAALPRRRPALAPRAHRARRDRGRGAPVAPTCPVTGWSSCPRCTSARTRTPPALAAFVRAGGHALVSYFSGIVDEADQVRLGGYPGAFAELLGVRVEEFAPLLPGSTVDPGRRRPGRPVDRAAGGAGRRGAGPVRRRPAAGHPRPHPARGGRRDGLVRRPPGWTRPAPPRWPTG